MAAASGNGADITTFLTGKGFKPKQAWISNFHSTQRGNVHAQALQSSAMFKMVHGDITASIEVTQSNVFPSDILNATIKERTLRGPIPVQVLDMEDMSQSRWSQAELLEAVERGETTRGREIIRVVANENDSDQTQATPTHGPHKLTLQDANGIQIFAFEMEVMPSINLNKLMIGSKLVLREVTVARAVVLLDLKSCSVMGGKLDQQHQKWVAERKSKLRELARTNMQR